eukprot:1493523-Pyramimonas_sp.AAC.1
MSIHRWADGQISRAVGKYAGGSTHMRVYGKIWVACFTPKFTPDMGNMGRPMDRFRTTHT